MEHGTGNGKVLIIGGGIGGLTTAIALRHFGIEAEIYERTPQMLSAGTALSVNSNAITALRSIGIDLGLEKHGQAVERFTMMNRRGRVIRNQPIKEISVKAGAPSVSISRSDLQRVLLESASGIPLTLGAELKHYTQDADGVTAEFQDGSEARGDLLIGADGFNSVVRRQMAGPEEPREAGYICWLAITDFSNARIVPGYVGHYWGSGERFGIVDLGGGRVYWWGTKNMPPARSHLWSGGKAEIAGTFSGWADEVQKIIDGTPPDAIMSIPARDRPFLEHWGDKRVTLLGDAAHPMLTSLAMGAATAIEDAVVLASALAEASEVAPHALRTYEEHRIVRTRMMVEKARALSKVEQLEGLVPGFFRNTFMRLIPKSALVRSNEEAVVFTNPIR